VAIINKRKVDEQSRLPLPLQMRQQLNLSFKDAVVWNQEGDRVIIRSGGKAVGLTGHLATRVDDMGKVQVPRSILQLGVTPGIEVELTCDGESISFPLPA
jgi:bifunctional DNA-binding transcriptional regulator/antitoxin component of YhaV-PrlF toxin-antitoxin module